MADCCAGRAERAWESLQKIMPDSRWNPSAHSGCEPYVFTNMYFGPENPRAGETSFAWVTGTAGWMLRAVTQYMFGFHPAYNGFSIRPCVPAAWGDCELLRQFRGDTYVLHIRRRGPNGRVARLFYDGAPVGADRLPLAGDGGEHRITVELE